MELQRNEVTIEFELQSEAKWAVEPHALIESHFSMKSEKNQKIHPILAASARSSNPTYFLKNRPFPLRVGYPVHGTGCLGMESENV